MKRKWLWILGGMCVAVALGFLVTLWYLSYKSLSMTIGRVLVAQNGTYMLIDGNSPIALSNRQKNDKLFEGLENGDKVWVLHDGIEETYPARTGAYAVWKLEDGDMDDIPKGVLDTLRELGWVAQVESNESVVQEASTKSVAFEAQYIRTNGYHESMEYPVVRVIHSAEELKEYYESNKEVYDLERRDKVYADTTIGFLDACDKYNESYFKNQVLVLVLLEEGSGSIRHEVTEVELVQINQEQELAVNITTKVPEIGTDDMAEWHIFVEPEPGVNIEKESQVTINLNGKVFKADTVADDSGDNALDTTRVSASHSERTLSINIPEGWEYEIKEYSDESSSFGIYFWPEGETEGKLSFLYYDAWGVCGTGLESETIEIGGYEASQGNYNGGIWEFICFQKEPGWCVIKNDAAYAWLGKHIDEAMEIIDTVRVK